MSNYTNNLFVPDSENNSWANLYSFITPKSRILDIGCSSGHFGEVLVNDKNSEVIGIDIDNDDIQKAKKVLNKAYVRNIETDDIKDLGKFDIIIFADVLEHLLNPVNALKKIKKSLKPNGKILFSIPNMAHVSIRLSLLKGFFEYTSTGLLDRTHLHYYDEQEVFNIFNTAGYKIELMKPTVYEYPKSVIDEWLKDNGLEANSKFYEHLKDTKAFVFQFIGTAKVDSNLRVSSRKLQYINPHDELMQVITARDQKIIVKDQRIQLLEKEINEIKNSKSWKMAKKISKVRNIYK